MYYLLSKPHECRISWGWHYILRWLCFFASSARSNLHRNNCACRWRATTPQNLFCMIDSKTICWNVWLTRTISRLLILASLQLFGCEFVVSFVCLFVCLFVYFYFVAQTKMINVLIDCNMSEQYHITILTGVVWIHQVLDEEKKGYIDVGRLSDLLTKKGIPFRPKELTGWRVLGAVVVVLHKICVCEVA